MREMKRTDNRADYVLYDNITGTMKAYGGMTQAPSTLRCSCGGSSSVIS